MGCICSLKRFWHTLAKPFTKLQWLHFLPIAEPFCLGKENQHCPQRRHLFGLSYCWTVCLRDFKFRTRWICAAFDPQNRCCCLTITICELFAAMRCLFIWPFSMIVAIFKARSGSNVSLNSSRCTSASDITVTKTVLITLFPHWSSELQFSVNFFRIVYNYSIVLPLFWCRENKIYLSK